MQRITLTGADERTNIQALQDLVERHPAVEIGLLYTATPEGRNRYPSPTWVGMAAMELRGRCAIHICGMSARRLLIAGRLDWLVANAPRVQVNGPLTSDELQACAVRVGTLITQHNERNAHLVDISLPNHALLIDGSGGQGITPTAWVTPATHKPVGFAGGMGPDNLAAELQRIGDSAKRNAWVDMEGKLRTLTPSGQDWFDIEKARACAETFDAFVAGMTPAVPRRARP